MMRRSLGYAVMVALGCGLATQGWAQELPPLDWSPAATVQKPRATHARKAPGTAAPASIEQVTRDLLHGSAAQRQLERTDNDLAGLKPIDHRNDEFGHEVRGQ